MPTLFFVLPIFNESPGLRDLIARIGAVQIPAGWRRQIIAVDDGSTDASLSTLQALAPRYPLQILSHMPNQGIPKVFREAFAFLKDRLQDDDVMIFMESDGTGDLSVIPLFLDRLNTGADVVIASRHVRGGAYVRFPQKRRFGSAIVNWFLRVLWRIPGVTDYTIFYRAYRGALLKKYIDDGAPWSARKSFAVNGELLLRLHTYAPRIAEVPLRYDYGLKKGKSKMKLLQTLLEYVRITATVHSARSWTARFHAAVVALRRDPLFWIALGALALRIWGIRHGLPDLAVLDEPALTRGALTMMKLKTLIPALHPAEFATMYYPPLTAYVYLFALVPVVGMQYLLSGIHSIESFASHLIFDPTVPWMATRTVSALVGSATVFFVGKLGEKIWKGSGIFAALFLATSFQHVMFSHIARHWTLSLLLILGMLWSAREILQTGSRSSYLRAGLFGGLGIGAGVVTAILMIAPIFAHLLRPELFKKKLFLPRAWMMGMVAVSFFAVFALLNPAVIFSRVGGGDNTFRDAKTVQGFASTFASAARGLGTVEPALFVFSVAGAVILLKKNRRLGIAYCATAVFVLGAIYGGYYYLLHYLLLLYPMLALCAGIGLSACMNFFHARTAKIVVVALVFSFPLAVVLRLDLLMSRPDTRALARRWVAEHLPADAKVIAHTPLVKIVWPTRETLGERVALDPSSARVIDRTLLSLPVSQYPIPAFDVFEISTMRPELREKVAMDRKFGAQLLTHAIVDGWAPPVEGLADAVSRGTLLARFPSDGLSADVFANEFNGPVTVLFRMQALGPPISLVRLLSF